MVPVAGAQSVTQHQQAAPKPTASPKRDLGTDHGGCQEVGSLPFPLNGYLPWFTGSPSWPNETPTEDLICVDMTLASGGSRRVPNAGYRVLARPADAGQPGVSYGERVSAVSGSPIGPWSPKKDGTLRRFCHRTRTASCYHSGPS